MNVLTRAVIGTMNTKHAQRSEIREMGSNCSPTSTEGYL